MYVVEAAADAVPPVVSLEGASLFLDFDGTLVDLAARPDAVAVNARLHTLMARLCVKLDGRLAVVSGRAAGDIFGLFGSPEFIVSGSQSIPCMKKDISIV